MIPDASRRLAYQPALDGLRAVAIILVLLHHAQLLSGSRTAGTVGVTAFFVLSAYLITAILLAEWRTTGTVSLGAFYIRRGRRLLPALALMLAVSTVGLLAVGMADLAITSALGAASYVANWVMIAGVSLGPVNHTWSLAIEEQFYLLWPAAFLLLLPRLGPRRLAMALLSLAIAVTLARDLAIVGGWHPQRYSMSTDLQADSLLVGCALGLGLVGARVPRLLLPAGVFGLVALAITPLTLVTGTLTVVATAAVILGSRRGTDRLVGPLLVARPMITLGRLSYGVYLWHYPVMWHAGVLDGPAQPALALALIAVSIAIAAASYAWVEMPIRRRMSRPATIPLPAPAPAPG